MESEGSRFDSDGRELKRKEREREQREWCSLSRKQDIKGERGTDGMNSYLALNSTVPI